MAKKGNTPWNKGLSKETDDRVKKYSDSLKGRVRNVVLTDDQRNAIGERTRQRYRNMTEEEKINVSKIQREANLKGWSNLTPEQRIQRLNNRDEAIRNLPLEKKIERNNNISKSKKMRFLESGTSYLHNPETWKLQCECGEWIIYVKYYTFQNAKSQQKKGNNIQCSECKIKHKKYIKSLGLHRKNKSRKQFETLEWQPNYNKDTIPYILDILNVRYATEFIHAESIGGEFRIFDDELYTHYFADAYCPKLNIWIEFDEPYHFKQGILKDDCQRRESRIRECLQNVVIHRIYFDKNNHNI